MPRFFKVDYDSVSSERLSTIRFDFCERTHLWNPSSHAIFLSKEGSVSHLEATINSGCSSLQCGSVDQAFYFIVVQYFVSQSIEVKPFVGIVPKSNHSYIYRSRCNVITANRPLNDVSEVSPHLRCHIVRSFDDKANVYSRPAILKQINTIKSQ